jgi:hypothetical protein
MSAQRTVNHWLDRFATRAGSAPLRLDERGLCAFTYADRFDIAIEVPEENAAHVYFSGTVMSIAELDRDDQMAFYREMLALNLFDARTRGASLAIDPTSMEVVLCYHYPIAALDDLSFYNLLTQFTQTVESMHREFTHRAAQANPQAHEERLMAPSSPPIWG